MWRVENRLCGTINRKAWIQMFQNHNNTMLNYYETILNDFIYRDTNAFAESFNAKIKASKAQFR